MQLMNYDELVEFGPTEYSKMGTSSGDFEREIWTDSKCILFPIDYLDKSVAIETLKEWRNI